MASTYTGVIIGSDEEPAYACAHPDRGRVVSAVAETLREDLPGYLEETDTEEIEHMESIIEQLDSDGDVLEYLSNHTTIHIIQTEIL